MALNLIKRNRGKEVNKAELYEKFIEGADDCFFIFDKKLFALAMNEAAMNLSGLKNIKKIGSDIKDILPNMNNTNRFDKIRDVLRTGKPYRYRDHVKSHGGEIRLFEMVAFSMDSGVGVIAIDITKRRTRLTPIASDNDFSSAVQAVIHDPFLILDTDNRVLSANHAFYDHFFLKPQDVLEETIYTLNETQWNIPALHELLDYKLTTTGSAKNYEINGYFTGLGDRTLKLNAKPFKMAADNRQVVLLAINDITELAKQRDNLKKLTAIFTHAADPIIVTDIRGDIINMNNEAVSLYGWGPTEILGRSFKTILAPDNREGYQTLLEGVLLDQPVRDVETNHWSKQGEVLPIMMSITLLKDQHDENLGTVAYMRHVPSHARAETALRELQNVILQSNDPVALLDLDGKIIDFNAAAEYAFGRQKESTLSKDGSILVCPEDREAYQSAFTNCLETNRGDNIKIRCQNRQEIVRSTELSFRLIPDARNQPTAMVVIEKLTSDSHKAERAYSQLFESLMDIPDPVIIEDMSGSVVDLNSYAVKFYGWKKTDLTGKKSKLLMPADRHEQNEELVNRCKGGEIIRDVKSTRWSKAGNHYAVSLTMFLINNVREEPEFVITIATPLDGVAVIPGNADDIDMEILFEDAVDPIIIEDLNGSIIKINAAASSLLGWGTRELQGKPTRSVIPTEKHKLYEKIILLMQNNVPIKHVESKLWSKRGKVFPVAVSLIMLKDSKGKPTAIASVHQDPNVLKKPEDDTTA